MRLTVCHCEPSATVSGVCDCPDLDATAGLTVSQFLGHAAEALDDHALASRTVWLGGRHVPAHTVIGQAPLTHGARLHTLPDDDHPLLTSGRALTGAHQPVSQGPHNGWLISQGSWRQRLGRWLKARLRRGNPRTPGTRPPCSVQQVPGLLERADKPRATRVTQLIGAGAGLVMAIGIGLWTGNMIFAAMSLVAVVPAVLGAGLFHKRADRRLHGLQGHGPSDLLTRALLRDQDSSIAVPPPEPDPLLAALLSQGAAAIVGDGDECEALARLLSCRWVEQTEYGHVSVADTLSGLPQWRWTRWLTQAESDVLPDDAAPTTLHISDSHGSSPPASAGLPSARHHHLCLVSSEQDVPAWCRMMIDAATGSVRVGHQRFTAAMSLPGVQWADDVARLLATSRSGIGTQPHPEPHATSPHGALSLLQVTGAPAPGLALDHWLDQAFHRDEHTHPPRGLTAVIGADAKGQPVALDLGRDGPHALIAGTTGAGKSQLLQTLIYGLALGARSDELALVLVDYKGGTSLGKCRDLPHVIGEVTDLDRAGALRALTGLRAEVRRREATIAAAGVSDIREYTALGTGDSLPRLVVVVDEFRAMADDLPEFMPELLTIAAQGRSLGIHLILATQRPAGAIGPEIRANVALRLCLRVTDDSESHDVIGTHMAARLSPTQPGQVYVRSGQDPVIGPIQTALSTRAPQEMRPVRLASYSASGEPVSLSLSLPAPDVADDLVGAFVRHHERHSITSPRAPWGEPLPDRVDRANAINIEGCDQQGYPIAITDHPEVPCHRVVTWANSGGTLAVTGPGGSGKTSAARSVIDGVRDSGSDTTVHILSTNLAAGLELWRRAQCADLDASRVQPGSVLVARDGPLLATVLSWLTFEADGEHLVVVDDADVVVETLEYERLGPVADQLLALIKQPPPGVSVVTTWTRPPRGIVERASSTIELWGHGAESMDPRVPRTLSAGAGIPGRCLVIHGEAVAIGQVFAPTNQPADHAHSLPCWRPLPAHLDLAECATDAVGIAGFDHGPLRLDLNQPLLISARKTDSLLRAAATVVTRHGNEFERILVSTRRADVEQALAAYSVHIDCIQPHELRDSHLTDPRTLVVILGDLGAQPPDVQQSILTSISAPGTQAPPGVIIALSSAELMSGYGDPMASIRQLPHQLHLAPFIPGLGELIAHEDRHLLAGTGRQPVGRALWMQPHGTRIGQLGLVQALSSQSSSTDASPTGLKRAVMAG